MNRRTFAGSTAASLLSVSLQPQLAPYAAASQATPETDDDTTRYVNDFAQLAHVEEGVTRYARVISGGLEMMMSGALYGVDAWGFVFSEVSSAQDAPLEIANAYEQWMTLENDVDFGDLQQASARKLGDESWGWVTEVTDADDDEYQWALFAVRKATTLQMLIGVASSGSPLKRLADISEGFIERWPNAEARKDDADPPEGGIWDTLPQLGDLEEGMVIDSSHDVTDDF